MKKVFVIFGTWLLLIISIAPPATALTITNGFLSDDFDDGDTAGWWLSPSGQWSVVDESLFQNKGGDHIVGLVDNLLLTDQVIETDVKIPLHTGGYGGVVFWYQDDMNYVEIIAYPYRGSFTLYDYYNGNYDQVNFPPQTHTGSFHRLSIDANSTTGELVISWDDDIIFNYFVNTPNRIGLSGVISGNNGAYFDNFQITSSDITANSGNADNCPEIYNPDQTDTDGDGIGDACDNCPLDPPVLIENTGLSYFDTIQAIYDDPAKVSSGDTILLQDQVYEEDLVLDKDIGITMSGGYDCDYNEPPIAYTTIRSMTISNGTVVVNGITLTDVPVPTVVSADGRIWMDRNLGASRVATSPTDSLAYGDLYQWGRLTDGHQIRTSPTTSTTSSTDDPGHGNFITTLIAPSDWRIPQNDNLWQGVSGTNNPCPAGFRLPTKIEWITERTSWASGDLAGAFDSPLKLILPGHRHGATGNIYEVDNIGYYWSSGIDDIYNSVALKLTDINSYTNDWARGAGFSVRCIMD